MKSALKALLEEMLCKTHEIIAAKISQNICY